VRAAAPDGRRLTGVVRPALDDRGGSALHDLGRAVLGEPGGSALGDPIRAALERRAAVGRIGQVGTTARLVGALVDITEMLYVGPPSWGLCVSHVVLTLFPWRPTG
jgi:hypothetical protein